MIIYWSGEEKALIAKTPRLRCKGKIHKEALANVEVIMREWLETAKQLRRPIPQPQGRLMYAQHDRASNKAIVRQK